MKHKYKFLIGIFFTILFHIIIYVKFPLNLFDYKVFDVLNNISQSIVDKKHKSSTIIIDIDEKSLEVLGQWPWSRLILTKLLEKIQKNYPSSIGLDILFNEKDRTSPNQIIDFYDRNLSQNIKIVGLNKSFFDNDIIFANQIKQSKVILPLFLNPNVDKSCNFDIKNINVVDNSFIKFDTSSVLCNTEPLQKSSYNTGFINAKSDKDGIFRRSPLFIKHKDKTIPSFALANLSTITDIKLDKNIVTIFNKEIKLNDDNNVLLNFYKDLSFKRISAYDILINNYNPMDISGKFVLIGSTAIGLNDHYKLSIGENIAGVDIHATIIDNILNGDLIKEIEIFSLVNILLSLFMSIIVIYLSLKHNIIGLISAFLTIVVIFILNLFFLTKNIYLHYAYFFVPFITQFFIMNLLIIFSYFKNKKEYKNELIKAHTSTIDNMISLIENRDAETGEHIKRIKEYVKCLSIYLYENNIYDNLVSKRFIDYMYMSSPLHDIGKIGIADRILQKPGKLTNEEYEIMKAHSEIGKKIIENSLKKYEKNSLLKMAYNIVYYHHEKWDGSGYPTGLSRHNIPLEARIMALADVYDALISKRCYKDAFEYKYSEEIIIKNRGKHFDPLLVDAFIELKDEFKKIADKYKD